MDGWMDGMDGWMVGWLDGWIFGKESSEVSAWLLFIHASRFDEVS
jgi:hypothetical protein